MTYNIQELKKFLHELCLSNEHIPLMIWSAPGIGKSSAVKQVADELGWGFKDMRLSLLNPVDLRGLPYIDKEHHKASWLEPDFLPNGRDTERGILFLDEINLAPASVMFAGYQLILDRRIGDYELPKGWVVVAAGNRATDGAQVTKFPAPLANRFVHITVEAESDTWIEWAIQSGIHEHVIAFLKKMPQHLFAMPKAGELAFPTPRSWAQASKLHYMGQPIGPSVGEGVEAEFTTFLKVYEKIPDVNQILATGDGPVPDKKDIDILWALCTALGLRAKIPQLPNVLSYLGKMSDTKVGREFEVLVMRAIIVKGGEEVEKALGITYRNEWSKFCERNKEFFPGGGK